MGETITGSTGSDTFVLNFGQEGYDHIDGLEAPDGSDIDKLFVNGKATVVYNPDDPESGTILWQNGEVTTFENIERVMIGLPCFTPGTLIETVDGARAVETLEPGDRVLTRDNGYRPLRWVGKKTVGADMLAVNPALQPVLIREGALGAGLPERDMIVSPQHRMLIAGPRAELLFGEREVLVAAIHLVGQPGIERIARERATYIHLLFDTHEIIIGDGAWTESFQPGEMILNGMGAAQRDEIFAIFPELKERAPREIWPAARLSLKGHEARALFAG